MAKNIEMNYLDSGGYEALYPKNVSDISLASPELQTMLSLSEGDSVDDAFSSLNDIIKAIQLGVAIVNLSIHCTDGTPVKQCLISGITSRDGSQIITDSNGEIKSLQVVEGDNLTITSGCDDITFSYQQSFVKGNVYNISISNAKKVTSLKYINNAGILNVSGTTKTMNYCLLGGGGGTSEARDSSSTGGGGGGRVYNGVTAINGLTNFSISIGSGGAGGGAHGGDGGKTTINGGSINSSASGGNGNSGGYGGGGNGDGGDSDTDPDGKDATVHIFGESGLGIPGGGGGGAGGNHERDGYGGSPNGADGTNREGAKSGKGYGGGAGGTFARNGDIEYGADGYQGRAIVRFNF